MEEKETFLPDRCCTRFNSADFFSKRMGLVDGCSDAMIAKCLYKYFNGTVQGICGRYAA